MHQTLSNYILVNIGYRSIDGTQPIAGEGKKIYIFSSKNYGLYFPREVLKSIFDILG